MNDFVSLACPHCGGKLEITSDIDRFACMYCGSEQIVNRRGGIISLSLITDAIDKVAVGTDKTAAELALVRLEKELAKLDDDKEQTLLEYPKPSLSPLSIISIGIGIVGLLSKNITVGFVGILFGIFLIVLYNNSYKSWESNVETYIIPIEKQIEETQSQYKKNQTIVSK